MRLFVAIELPEDVKDYLYNLQKEIGNSNAKIRWVAKKNIHQTLKFIGNIEDNKMEEIKKRLKEVKYNKFEFKLNKLGWFPGGDSVRVIWVDVKPDKDVIELQKLIDISLLDMIKSDQRFYAHFTIGRVKLVRNKEAFLNSLNAVKIKEMKININEFHLIRSQLSRNGPMYSIVERYKLG